MLSKIASDVEPEIEFKNYPPVLSDETHALTEALNTIDKILNLKCIVSYTSTGYTAILAAAERPKVPVVALTPDRNVYHRLNLVWGVKPVLLEHHVNSFEGLIDLAQDKLLQRKLAQIGDRILIVGGIPANTARGTNFLKIHTLSD